MRQFDYRLITWGYETDFQCRWSRRVGYNCVSHRFSFSFSFFFFFQVNSKLFKRKLFKLDTVFALTVVRAVYIQPVTFENVFCPLGCHSFKLICLWLLWPLNTAAAFPPVEKFHFSSTRRCHRPKERPSAGRCFASISAEYGCVWSQIKCLSDSIAPALQGSAGLRWVCPPQ